MSTDPFDPAVVEPHPQLDEEVHAFGDDDAAASGPDPADATAPLGGRLALVTGATGLLGAAIGRRLAGEGADVCLLGRDLAELDRVVASFDDPTRSVVLRADLASADEVVAAVDFVRRMDRPVDVVVHAAGIQEPSLVSTGAVRSLDEHYLLNVRGPYLLTQQLSTLLAPRARCVFVVGDHVAGSPGAAHHAVTTAAAQALAAEVRAESSSDGPGVMSVRTSELTGGSPGPDPASFAESVAGAVLAGLVTGPLEWTELTLRPQAHPIAVTQQ